MRCVPLIERYRIVVFARQRILTRALDLLNKVFEEVVICDAHPEVEMEPKLSFLKRSPLDAVPMGNHFVMEEGERLQHNSTKFFSGT